VKEKFKKLLFWIKERKNYLLFIFLIFLLSGISAYFSIKKESKPKIDSLPSPIPTQIPPSKQERTFVPPPVSPPQVNFENYENLTVLPALPEKIKTYTIKNNFRPEEILSFGKRLGLNKYKKEGDFAVLTNLADPDKMGILVFKRATGEFYFQSYGNHLLESEGSSVGERVKNFLINLGVIDETVSCPITYQRQGLGGMTFVECHRDWNKAGLPI